MSCGLSLVQTFRCAVCRQLIDDDRVQEGRVGAYLFGAVPYAVCAACHQPVPRPWRKAYRAAWDLAKYKSFIKEGQMADYVGTRPLGETQVLVDGMELPWRLDIRKHSPTGLEWGYLGSGPAQLALAILCDHFFRHPDDVKLVPETWREDVGFTERGQTASPSEVAALAVYQRFKGKCINALPRDGWALTSDDVRRHIAEIGRAS